MENRQKFICLLIFLLAAATQFGCEKPARIEDITSHFEQAGLEVSEPDYGRLSGILKGLETGMNTAPAFGRSRPQMKTVMVDGVMTTIHQFKNSGEAKRFFTAYKSLPDPGANLPKRMQSMMGKPRLVLRKNIMLRITEGLSENDDSEKVDNIEKIFLQY